MVCTSSLVIFLQPFGWYTERIEHLKGPVPEGAEKNPFPLPSPRGGEDLCRDDTDTVPAFSDTPHDLDILHQGDVPIPANFFKVLSPYKYRLVPEGDPRKPCTEEDILLCDPEDASAAVDAQIEGSGNKAADAHGRRYHRERVFRQQGISMEKEENITERKRRSAIHLARTPFAGNDLSSLFILDCIDRASLWIAVHYDDLGRTFKRAVKHLGDDPVYPFRFMKHRYDDRQRRNDLHGFIFSGFLPDKIQAILHDRFSNKSASEHVVCDYFFGLGEKSRVSHFPDSCHAALIVSTRFRFTPKS